MIIQIHKDRCALGAAAARDIAECLRGLLQHKRRVTILFAAAPSQNETLAALAAEPEIDWARVTALHLDEYVGLPDSSPASFRSYIRRHVLEPLGIGQFEGLRGDAPEPEAECARYAALLDELRPDAALLGIGENGHLAFIDPPWCDFADRALVKVVSLDDVCRRQQVADGCFATLADVPRRALSLTIPAMLRTPNLFVMVPGTRKAEAVRAALQDPVTVACPASALQTAPEARIYLDDDSARLVASSTFSASG